MSVFKIPHFFHHIAIGTIIQQLHSDKNWRKRILFFKKTISTVILKVSQNIFQIIFGQIATVILMGLLVSNVMNMEYVIVWRVPQETSVMEHPLALCQYCHLYVCSIASLHENYYLDCNYIYQFILNNSSMHL